VRSTAVAWHDVECASYQADLPVWRELAAERPGPVLDLGCGTGRVALDLADRGHRVTALDSDPEFVHALASRARMRGLRVDTVTADARSFSLGKRFGLIIAPMQVFQLLGGPEGRRAALARAREHLEPGGPLAVALADPFEAVTPEDALPPMPDVREEDGWVFSSQPVAVRLEGGGVAVDRLRQLVSPAGELSEELHTVLLDAVRSDELESEAAAAGLAAAGRRVVPPTPDHVGSTVVVCKRSARPRQSRALAAEDPA
jgi:SAM-dependent methyltransferase